MLSLFSKVLEGHRKVHMRYCELNLTGGALLDGNKVLRPGQLSMYKWVRKGFLVVKKCDQGSQNHFILCDLQRGCLMSPIRDNVKQIT